ncbi:MAG TPA: YecA family protein [Leucothrix mucor]|nr:YecA family protein [Leucothrix mucor]
MSSESLEFSADLFADLFTDNPEIQATSIGHYQTYGFVLAIASSPEKLSPVEWQPLLFKDNKLPDFTSPEMGRTFTFNIRSLWDHFNKQLKDEMVVLPAACDYSPASGANLELIAYCSGYLKGYVWLKDVWDHAIEAPETGDSKADMMIKMLLFALMSFNKTKAEIAKESKKERKVMSVEKAWKLLPTLLTSVGINGQAMSEIEKLTVEQNAKLEAVQPIAKIGRNDPCYCGSGKKYKKCCLQ